MEYMSVSAAAEKAECLRKRVKLLFEREKPRCGI